MPKPKPQDQPGANPDQETRNDDPNVQEQREQRARGDKDQAEGDRSKTPARNERIPGPGTDERIAGADDPRGDRVHGAREARQPGGGRKGQPR